MGLRDTIKLVADAAFNAVGDIKTSCTYIQRSSAYTPASGAVVNTDVTATIQGIIIPPGPIRKAIMRDRSVVVVTENQTRLICRQSELTGIVPRIKDLITVNSVNWQIEEISWDPADATYTFSIKRP